MEVRMLDSPVLSTAKFEDSAIGRFPVDWPIQQLGNIATIHDGTHQTPRYTLTGVPFYSVEQVTSNDFNSTKFISEAEFEQLSKSSRIEQGDVLMTRIGSIGDCRFVDWHVRAGYYVSLALLKFRDPALAKYFAHYSRTGSFKKEIDLHSLAHAIPKKINLGPISHLRLPVPPLAEQVAMSEALSDADALIDSLEQLLAKKRQVMQGAMQELLTGERRLAGYTANWVVRRIGSFAPLQRGFDLPSRARKSGSHPVVYSNGILNFHNEYRVKGPGVVTGRSGTIGAVTFVEQDFWPHNTALWVTNFYSNDPKFVFYMFKHVGLERFATGSGVPTLNRNDVHAFEVRVPNSVAEQACIANALTDMDTEISALESRLAKARALKQAMAQALLTGRIRLVQAGV